MSYRTHRNSNYSPKSSMFATMTEDLTVNSLERVHRTLRITQWISMEVSCSEHKWAHSSPTLFLS